MVALNGSNYDLATLVNVFHMCTLTMFIIFSGVGEVRGCFLAEFSKFPGELWYKSKLWVCASS